MIGFYRPMSRTINAVHASAFVALFVIISPGFFFIHLVLYDNAKSKE
jgi:hypothetical protein